MARLPATYRDIDLAIIDDADLDIIELRAKVLTLSECLVLIGVEESDLSEGDMAIAHRVWNRGRMKAISDAGTKLFSQMSQRGGHVPALDYLRQMSGTFQAEVVPAGQGFKFNVCIDPEDK
tara:strand:+ start:212 stop:574 length:363 start_codon:yes stop_codon:yes gene_type:complete